MTPLDELSRIESVIDSKHAVAADCLTVSRRTLKQLVADARSLHRDSYQARIGTWVRHVFGSTVAADTVERALRAAEEVVELAQACGVKRESLHRLVDYVFSRPTGDPAQEIGGCMLTVYAVAESLGSDANALLESELERIQHSKVIERCRYRQTEKRAAYHDSGEALGDLWTVVGLYERGKYIHDTFVCYIGGSSAAEARDFAIRKNAERGDKIEVLACVSGGGVAHVFAAVKPGVDFVLALDGELPKTRRIDALVDVDSSDKTQLPPAMLAELGRRIWFLRGKRRWEAWAEDDLEAILNPNGAVKP